MFYYQVLEYTGDLEDCIAMSAWIFSERFAALQKGSYPVIHPLLFLSSKIGQFQLFVNTPLIAEF